MCFQVFLFNTNNDIVLSNYFYLITDIQSHLQCSDSETPFFSAHRLLYNGHVVSQIYTDTNKLLNQINVVY